MTPEAEPTKPTAITLDDALLAEADAVGHRLRACVDHTIRRAQQHCRAHQKAKRTTQNTAETLGIDAILAKKLTRLTDPARTGTDIVAQAPRPEQLNKLADHLEHHKESLGLTELELWPLRDAIRKLERLVDAARGSKMRLTRALRAHRDNTSPQNNNDHRADPGDRTLLLLGTDSTIRTDSGERWGTLLEANPLAHPNHISDAIDHAPAHTTLIIPTGRFEPDPIDPDGAAHAAAARTWSPEGADALLRALRPLLDHADARRVRLALRPRVGDALADAQSASSFRRRARLPGLSFAIDPAGLLTPAMVARAHDHARRSLETLGSRASAVLIADAEPMGDDELAPAAWGEGRLGPDGVAALAREHAPGVPAVVRAADADAARRALGLG